MPVFALVVVAVVVVVSVYKSQPRDDSVLRFVFISVVVVVAAWARDEGSSGGLVGTITAETSRIEQSRLMLFLLLVAVRVTLVGGGNDDDSNINRERQSR